ncbi:MAG: DUF169 domain-containing protein [Actinomycetota bacterium]
MLPVRAALMQEILGMSTSPVAVKFHEEFAHLPGYELPEKRRYCQVLMEARRGKRVLLTPENIACPAAAWALGFKEPPSVLVSGEMPASMGIFGNPDAVVNTFSTMQRLEMGKYGMVEVCPLGEAAWEPDVVVVESLAEHLMWIALAHVFHAGGRLHFDTAVLQATCVDVTVTPFVQRRLNISIGCYGCREATDLAEGECVLGFPGEFLDEIVESLEALREKAMPRVRGKNVYKALLERSEG